MCGITGLVHFKNEPVSPAVLKKMTKMIRHRGPDGEGFYVQENIGFGHRRLKILDLSKAGAQPMLGANGNFVLTYNGEVYNYLELKKELMAKQHTFISRTDSEVVLNSLIEWGVDALSRFNGMFAFAFFDKQKQELILARDRFGIKPLYYSVQNNTLLFASEVKAFLAHPDFKVGLDQEALLEYFTFQNFFTDKTLFQNVHLLPAGSYLKIHIPTQKIVQEKYWDYDFSGASLKSEEAALEELDFLFQQSVHRQLMSDVPVGSYLSGGMDSGSITLLASKKMPSLKTFTVGFDVSSASGLELAFDEREKAEYISYLAGTEHYQMVLKAGDMERAMEDLVWHLEEPRVGQSYPNFYAAKLAAKFGKVVLAGTGGDELWGGYPWRYYRAVSNANFEDYIDKYYSYWQRLLTSQETEAVFSPIWENVKKVDTRQIFRDVFVHQSEIHTPEDYIHHSLYLEAKTFLHGLLVVEDKLSMAHGLETRVPFLDNDLVQFAMQMPIQFKLKNLKKVIALDENEPGPKTQKYYNKMNDGKLILRKMMEKYIPKSITQGIKQGFSAPDASWFKGESIEFVRQSLMDTKAPIYDHLDKKATQALILEHLEGKKNRRLLIWSLLYFNQWCKLFLNAG